MPHIWFGHRRRFVGAGFVASLIALAPLAAPAQTAPADRIDAIEHQIQGLQSELQQLKSELGETKRQLSQAREAASRAKREAVSAHVAESNAVQAAARAQAVAAVPPPPPPPPPPAAAKPGPHVVQTAGNRFGLESADGRNSIFLTGRLQ